MKTPHTPGPWEVLAGTIVIDEKGDVIATVPERCNDVRRFKETRNNARLIAAAPLLLSELKRLVIKIQHGGETWEEAEESRKLIASIEGEA